MREQEYWPEHVTFINGAVDDGFVLLGGPIADGGPPEDRPTSTTGPVGDRRIHRALLIVAAQTGSAVAARLDEDPWTTFGLLKTTATYRWEVLVGELAAP